MRKKNQLNNFFKKTSPCVILLVYPFCFQLVKIPKFKQEKNDAREQWWKVLNGVLFSMVQFLPNTLFSCSFLGSCCKISCIGCSI